MQFVGQSHILTVPLPGAEITRDELRRLFENAYWDRFAVDLPEIRAVLVNLHTAVIGRRPSIDLATLAPQGPSVDGAPVDRSRSGVPTAVARRSVWFETGWRETPIYRRDDLVPGSTFLGPAIVQQLDTTTVIEPDCRVSVDDAGNLIVSVGRPAELDIEVLP
jgi:N-methylhydantoinase A